MNKSVLIILILSCIIILGTSCSKKGCTDPNAENWDQDAKKDDETCTYICYMCIENSNLIPWEEILCTSKRASISIVEELVREFEADGYVCTKD